MELATQRMAEGEPHICVVLKELHTEYFLVTVGIPSLSSSQLRRRSPDPEGSLSFSDGKTTWHVPPEEMPYETYRGTQNVF